MLKSSLNSTVKQWPTKYNVISDQKRKQCKHQNSLSSLSTYHVPLDLVYYTLVHYTLMYITCTCILHTHVYYTHTNYSFIKSKPFTKEADHKPLNNIHDLQLLLLHDHFQLHPPWQQDLHASTSCEPVCHRMSYLHHCHPVTYNTVYIFINQYQDLENKYITDIISFNCNIKKLYVN